MGSERHILLTKGLTRVIGVVADLDKKKGRWTIRFLGLFGEQTQEVNIDSNEEMSRTLASISAMWKLANPHLR